MGHCKQMLTNNNWWIYYLHHYNAICKYLLLLAHWLLSLPAALGVLYPLWKYTFPWLPSWFLVQIFCCCWSRTNTWYSIWWHNEEQLCLWLNIMTDTAFNHKLDASAKVSSFELGALVSFWNHFWNFLVPFQTQKHWKHWKYHSLFCLTF
jgi:hypothetical protein